MRSITTQLESTLRERADPGSFSEEELEGLPGPVRRHLAAVIAPGAPLARTARLQMRGQIKIGRWVPFRAQEVLTPARGFVWRARAAGLLVGYDHYANGHGGMDWKLAALLRVVHAEGRDVSRAAAERAGAEAFWLPTALLPRFGVTWSATDDKNITAHLAVDGYRVDVEYRVERHGFVESLVFQRWHEPDANGVWATAPFGGDLNAYRTFGDVTIPSAGTFGWFYGTDRWPEGEFFRYEITALELQR
jgi:hypothetical protein